MFDLNKRGFKPLAILYSIVLLPCCIGLTIGTCFDFEVRLLIINIALWCCYFFILFAFYFGYNRGNKKMNVCENYFEIFIYKSGKLYAKSLIKYCEIKYIEYYRITSIKGWLGLIGYILPKSVMIIYKEKYNKQNEFLGFMNLKDIKQILENKKIKLIIK